MTTTKEVLKTIGETLSEEARTGKWRPAPGDALDKCEFLKAGFRSYGLEAFDKTWRLVLSNVDLTSSDPKIDVAVSAPGHDAAFGDLDGLVFTRRIGPYGGQLFNTVVKDIASALGGAGEDWRRRLDYLVARTTRDIMGRSNGTFRIDGRPVPTEAVPYLFDGRLRLGRTMSFYGPGGAGKTTIVDGLVASLCTNQEILPGWRPMRHFTTLVLDWDEGSEEEVVRLAGITNAHNVDITGYHYKRMARPLADVVSEIGRYIVEENIEVVVISPVEDALRQQSQASTGASVVNELHEVLREFKTTNILIDHVTGDNTRGGATREYGSVRKRDKVRGSFSVYPQKDMEQPGSRCVTISNTKSDALMPRRPDEAVRIDYSPAWPYANGSYDTIRFSRADLPDTAGYGSPSSPIFHPISVESQPAKMARLLLEHGTLTSTQLCARSGFDAKRLRDIARDAREKGFHIRHEAGVWSIDQMADED